MTAQQIIEKTWELVNEKQSLVAKYSPEILAGMVLSLREEIKDHERMADAMAHDHAREVEELEAEITRLKSTEDPAYNL